MTVSLQLTSEAESHLNELAAAAGISVEEYLRQLVERQAAASPPHNEGRDLERVQAAVQAIRELAKGNSLGGVSIRELIEEGRRF